MCNATGYDIVQAKVLRMGSDILYYPISYLLNISLKVCNFPSSLKYAEICPVLKKGNNLDASNYRPDLSSPVCPRYLKNNLLIRFRYIFQRYLVHIFPGLDKNIVAKLFLCAWLKI